MSSRFTHVLACVMISFLFKTEQFCLSIHLLMDMQATFTFCQYYCNEHKCPQASCADTGQRMWFIDRGLPSMSQARGSIPAGVLWLSLYSLALILLLSMDGRPSFSGDEGLVGEAVQI